MGTSVVSVQRRQRFPSPEHGHLCHLWTPLGGFPKMATASGFPPKGGKDAKDCKVEVYARATGYRESVSRSDFKSQIGDLPDLSRCPPRRQCLARSAHSSRSTASPGTRRATMFVRFRRRANRLQAAPVALQGPGYPPAGRGQPRPAPGPATGRPGAPLSRRPLPRLPIRPWAPPGDFLASGDRASAPV
jgi:hypothetical protein